MAREKRAREKPYIWVTWIVPLLSGDKQCEWAAWFKAHFQDYEKRQEDAESEARLSQWKAEHQAFVEARAEQLRALGYTVKVETQNKFSIEGETATVAGQIDLIASKGGDVLVEDMKTGKRRESDYWQVMLYLAFGRLVKFWRPSDSVVGGVVYRGEVRQVTAASAAQAAALISAKVKRIGGPVEPHRTPSSGECRFCEIMECPDRVSGEPAKAKTRDF